MRSPWIKFGAVALIQLVVLLVLPANQYAALMWGQTVTLKVRPYDPFSVLSGSYVRMNYDVGQPVGLDSFHTLPESAPVYTVISPTADGYWEALQSYTEVPETQGRQLVMRGMKRGTMIQYGIEEKYFPESLSVEVNQALIDFPEDSRAIVKISKSGGAALRGLIINGKKY